ncbi:hypothetical protein [Loktanella sp. SALINAS62]|uniref:hypothetical protein n=1 Tax=Loktanella sp. SALINAS62 TaxID=2706124 RepID=UPI001B8C989B|nr:hypothetical protein [Loktanella sp. SALINAS62]MBS1303366.1 hypothetical protein [Loktanella sp. SALINAS62]
MTDSQFSLGEIDPQLSFDGIDFDEARGRNPACNSRLHRWQKGFPVAVGATHLLNLRVFRTPTGASR